MASDMQQPKSAVNTPLPWILKIRATKRIQSESFGITYDLCSVILLESREQRYIKVMTNNKPYTQRYTVTTRVILH